MKLLNRYLFKYTNMSPLLRIVILIVQVVDDCLENGWKYVTVIEQFFYVSRDILMGGDKFAARASQKYEPYYRDFLLYFMLRCIYTPYPFKYTPKNIFAPNPLEKLVGSTSTWNELLIYTRPLLFI